MATDRKIKSDAQIDIEATQVDIGANTNVTGNVTATGTVEATGDITTSGNVNGVASTLSGNLSAVDGDFSGNVDATGNVNAANSTLSGNLGAVDGTFSGNVSVTGTINSFNFPSSDGSANQVIKTDGNGNLAFVNQSGGGSSQLVTIASQTDATNYSNSPGDIILVSGQSGAIDFPNSISQSLIYLTGNDEITFSGAVISCEIRSENSTTLRFEDSIFRCNITHQGGYIVIGPYANNRFIADSRISTEQLLFATSGNGSIQLQRSFINVNRFGATGVSHNDDKIHIKDGTIVEADFVANGASPDITVSRHSTFRVMDFCYGKIYDYNRSAYIVDRTVTNKIEVPFEIIDNLFRSKVPVAGRFGITADVTVDVSSSSVYSFNINDTILATGGLALTGTGRVKIPYSGWYQLGAGIYIDSLDGTSDDASIRWRITVNGSSKVYNQELQISNSHDHIQDTASVLFYCNAEDEIGLLFEEFGDANNSIEVKASQIATFLTVQMV